MPYTLPEWFELDAATLRAECGLQPHQIAADADEASLEATITGHIATQAARVLADARQAAGSRSFPSTDAELLKAFPIEVEFPVLHLHDATESTKEAALHIVKADAYQLWVPAYVSLKFPFQIGDPDDAEHGQVTPDQSVIEAATTAATADRAARIIEQKQLVMEATTSFVYAKLWYAIAPPDSEYFATANGHFKNAQALLSALKKNLTQIRAAYQLRSCPFV